MPLILHMNENKSMLRDCSATESLIFRLIIGVVLFGVLLVIVFIAKRENLQEISEQQILGEIQRIEQAAVLLYKLGGERDINRGVGSLQILKLHIPESMDYAAFGAGTSDLSFRSEVEANLYHYKLQNGKKQVFSSKAKFCAAEFKNGSAIPLVNKPAILHPGNYELYLELIRFENKTYVMLYGGNPLAE
jgi:hypothetical protein